MIDSKVCNTCTKSDCIGCPYTPDRTNYRRTTTGGVFEKHWCASKHVMCQFATINGFCKLTACINH